MAKYSVLLVLPDGNPFVTPDSTPLTLYRRASLNSQYDGDFSSVVIEENIVNQKAGTVLARTSTAVKISAAREGSLFNVSASNYRRTAFIFETYFFTIAPQTLPSHGIAIRDESGTLVLTNESRVLTDLTTIEIPGTVTGGTNIDITMPREWVVGPTGLGSIIIHAGSAPGGQPIFQPVGVGAGRHDDTGGTRIRGQSSTTASDATTGTTNSGIVMTAINTAAYD